MTEFFKYQAKALLKGILFIVGAFAFIALFFVSSFVVFASTMPPRPVEPLHFATAVDSGSRSVSSNWSGYVAQNQGTSYTSVNGSWTVPYVQNTSAFEADATWVGIGGVGSQDLIQAGTETILSSGQTTYQAWYELLPQASVVIPVPVKSGDVVAASIIQTSPNFWQISFKDNTTGKNYTTTVNYASSLSSAEWIEEMPSTQNTFVPLDNFGSVSFTGASTVANAIPLTIASSGATALNMLNNNNQALVTPSALGADGSSFTVTRTSASVTAEAIGTGSSGGKRWRRTGVGIRGFRVPVVQTISPQPSDQSAGQPYTHLVRYFNIGGFTVQIYQRIFKVNF